MKKELFVVESQDTWHFFKSRKYCGSTYREKIPSKFKIRRPKAVRQLAEKILSIAGHHVCIDRGAKSLAGLVLTDGKLFKNYHITVWKKEQHRCHANSAITWHNYPDRYSLVNGFCFVQGTWAPHSWLIRNGEKKIVDTICKCDKYFGVILKPELAQLFYRYNVGENKNKHRNKK